jgi:hypothetical protein
MPYADIEKITSVWGEFGNIVSIIADSYRKSKRLWTKDVASNITQATIGVTGSQ